MTSKNHIYPLSAYDKNGRLKPPLIMYFAGLYTCKALVIFILDKVNFANTDSMLPIFYPDPIYMAFGLLAGLPGMMTLIALSYRENLINTARVLVTYSHVYVQIALFLHIVIVCIGFAMSRQQPSPFVLAGVFPPAILLYILLKSSHVKDFIQDWREAEEQDEKG